MPRHSAATDNWLDVTANAAKNLREAEDWVDYLRDEFKGIIKATKIAGATQQEIANKSGFSRQRIAQLLKGNK